MRRKRKNGTKGKLRNTSIRPFIVETALSRQVQPNYKNSSVARPVICLAYGSPLFTCHRFRPLLPHWIAALPFYFSFIVGVPQLQLRNAHPREISSRGGNTYRKLHYFDLYFIYYRAASFATTYQF